ncbi:hypothetical protein [Marivirga arenosa]|uniref:Uncharacterized protein n=1 Tax=Marivirga arenosa TaxID=3059076 RepID=A0AA51X3Y5_9BACT|nr:hypothetical protein [Marivirga sp. BKB1-2]WNB17048.1 hypothetical protein QYS47_32725 [Marivirga sp. BKB1-2]
MKLSPEEINQIKAWISKRGFTHTDVQFEIIDHVASAIEDLREEKPELDLESAYNKVRSKFGPMGFLSIEESIQKRYQKELNHAYLNAAKSFIASPKMIILALFWIVLFQLSKSFPDYFKMILQSIVISLVVFSFGYSLILYLSKRHIRKYLSFKMSVGIIALSASLLFNIRFLYLEIVHHNLSAFLVSLLPLIIYSVYKGSLRMINKTEELNTIYQ